MAWTKKGGSGSGSGASYDDTALRQQIAGKSDTGHKHTTADLTDVDLTNKTEGYVLTWDTATNKMKNKPLPAGTGSGATNLDGLTDVDITATAPVEGDTLTFKSGVWVAAPSAFPQETARQAIRAHTLFAPVVEPLEPMITFCDDDGKAAVLNRVQPLVEAKGIPWALAIPSTDIIMTAGRSLTTAEVLHFQNDLGCEILGHTHTHQNLSQITEAQLETELGESKKLLVSKGYNIRGIAYPFGANSDLTRKIAGKYYDWGVMTQSKVNTYPVRAFQVDRGGAGSFMAGLDTLADYKAKVDEAVTKKGWYWFTSHCYHADHTDAQQQIISDLIDYIKSINVKIVNPSVGWARFGNVVEVENKVRVTNRGEVIVDNDTTYKTIRDTTKLPDALLTEYPVQTIVIAEYGNANKGALPEAGVLETKRSPNTTDHSYSVQMLYGISGAIYRRLTVAYNDATWAPWKKLTPV